MTYEAHCMYCGKQLLFQGGYYRCPTHGLKWYPIQQPK